MLQRNCFLFLFLYIITVPVMSGQGPGVSDTLRGIPDKIGANTHRATTLQALRKKAAESQSEGNYGAAIQYYQMILEARPVDSIALVNLADVAYRYTKYDKAVWAYQTLFARHMIKDPDGMLAIRVGDSYYALGNFTEARAWYERVDGSSSSSAEARRMAKIGLSNLEWAIQTQEDFHMSNITLDTLPAGVNTRYSEYSPIWTDSLLYYSTYGGYPYRETEKYPERRKIQAMTAEPFPDTILVRPASFNEEGKHTAYATFNSDKSFVYYAIGKNADEKIEFALYRRKRQASGEWGPAERLPDYINEAGCTNTQPNIGFLPGEKTETLFFVSDRSGGLGKKDIWYSRIQNDTFARPVNLGKVINTPEDDVTPFFDTPGKTFYFSSTGHRQHSLGGFDVFHSAYTAGAWSAPEAMPAPVNSGANDVFYSVPACSNMAFFSSNRAGSMNFSEEDCCYDLFRVLLNSPAFVASTFHKITGDSLANTTMHLLEVGQGAPVDLGSVTETSASRTFKLDRNKKYMLIASKPGFVADTAYFESPKTIWSCSEEVRLYLRPIKVKLIASVYDCDSKAPLNGSVFKFFDDAQVLSNGTLATGMGGGPLDSMITTEEASHIKTYDLEFNHRYQLFVSKAGYTDDSVRVSTEYLDRDTTLDVKLYLCQGLYLDVFVWDDITKKPLFDDTIFLTDIPAKKMSTHLTGPDAHDYHTVIFYDRRYKVEATKEGYSADSREFRTDDMPRKPFNHMRIDLYLRPLDPAAYLPIVLYFDNDEPDNHTLATVTKKEYREAYIPYYNRKQKYIDEYTYGTTGVLQQDRQFEMDTFFDNRVRGEWDKLRFFSERLYDIMESGRQVNIVLKGFASPRGKGPYNLNLTSRRVKSVLNHFSKFDGSIYQPYIDSGRLQISLEPYGSSQAPPGVDATDKRLSIYSPSAAKERRVEIIGVQVLDISQREPGKKP